MRRVLVCGGRHYKNGQHLFAVLDEAHGKTPISTIVHGGARGADSLAGEWAACRGVPCDVYKADWDKYGNRAGPVRNQLMLDAGKPDLVIAFPGSRGTADMVGRSTRAGLRVVMIRK